MRYYIEEDTSTTPPTLVKVPICGSYVNYNTAPIGSIQQYSGTSLPPGWLWCNGSAYNRTFYKFLFNVIGTTYGTGDGSTTFNVPSIPDLATGIKYIIKAYSTADAKELGIDPAGDTYSTIETRVGTWIDGKPIYRKVLSGTVTTYTDDTVRRTFAVTTSLTFIDKLIDMKGNYTLSDGTNSAVSSVNGIWISTDMMPFAGVRYGKYSSGEHGVWIYSKHSYTSASYELVLEYTKQ